MKNDTSDGQRDKKTSIVILTHNGLDYTKTCVASIREYTTDPSTPYELIIVDNNSTDGTVEWLETQNDIKVIFNTENLGFPAGCNQGIRMADPENDILLLNNDVIVTRNWLANLKTALYSEENIGATGAVTNCAAYWQEIATPYNNNLDEMQDFAAKNNVSDMSKWERRLILISFCMLIKRDALNIVGELDERFFPGYYEDDDYSYRLILGGFKLLLCFDVFIHHFGGATFKKDEKAFSNIIQINRKKFKTKWGFDSAYSGGIRTDVIGFIKRNRKVPLRVLEIGCACGATLLKIKHLYKNAEVAGIELNAQSAKIAACLADVRCADIEKTPLSFPAEHFDYIIAGDVLEHLYDPWKVLNELKTYLKPAGRIIASIPNVMNYTVLFELINGNWTYSDDGILDRTHLRFFTLREITKMFEQAGYTDLEIDATSFPDDPLQNEYLSVLTAITSKELEKQYVAAQYLVSAKKAV